MLKSDHNGSYKKVNGLLDDHPAKKQKTGDSNKPTKWNIHDFITSHRYDDLRLVLENQEQFRLLSPSAWIARMKFDLRLVTLACNNAEFMAWLALDGQGMILCDLARGDPRRSTQENKVYFDLIEPYCRKLVPERTYDVMITYLRKERGYPLERENTGSDQSSFPVCP